MDKDKKELIEEIDLLKERVAELEKLCTELRQQHYYIKRFETVVRDSKDSIIIQDVDGRITAWNRGAEKMYGYKEKEAIGMSIERLTPPDKLTEYREFIRRLIASEAVPSFETQRVTKDGSILDVWLTATKVSENLKDSIISTGRDETKPVSGIAFIERNISERKRAEEDLRNGEEKYRRFIETSQEGFGEVDRHFRIVSVNRRLCQMFGYDAEEEMKGLHVIDDLIPADGRVEMKRRLSARLEGKAATYAA